MPPARIYTRAYERYFAASAPMYQGDVNWVVEFAGQVDEVRLRQAFLAALAAEPMWSYRFVAHWWMPYWQVIPREERPHLVSVRHCANEAERHAAWEHLLDGPLDAAARVVVLRTPGNDRVCLRVDHRLADSGGARPLLLSVADNYRARAEPPARDAPLVRRTASLLRTRLSIRDRLALLRAFIANARRTAQVCGFTPREPTNGDPYASPRLLHYPEGTLDLLAARAMRDRATPVMVILGATYLALRDVLGFAGGVCWPISLPVNLRRYLPPEEQTAPASLLVGQVDVWIDPGRASDLDAVVAQIRAELTAQRGPYFGLVHSPMTQDLPLLRHYLHVRPFTWMQQDLRTRMSGGSTPGVLVSDLGGFGRPGDTWADVPIENSYCTQGTWRLPTILIGVSSCGSRLTLSVGSGPGSFVRPFAERIDFHLSRYSGWTPLHAIAALQASAT